MSYTRRQSHEESNKHKPVKVKTRIELLLTLLADLIYCFESPVPF